MTQSSELSLSMARGDIYSFSFAVFIDDEQSSQEMDQIYFTVKKNYYDKSYLIQKRLSDNGIVSDGHGNYSVIINPEDTNNLELGVYDFDIELVKMPSIKRTFVGTLELTKEVTHWNNEVQEVSSGG